jgi:2Fe-2S ferredoxin
MVKIFVTDRLGRTVEVDAEPGISIMENIRELDASVDAICGGMCACATCHVWVHPDWVDRLPPRSYEEQVMLDNSAHFDPARSRLSCQITTAPEHSGLAITVVPEE